MSAEKRNAIERIVETFEMGTALPEDLNLNAPEIQAFIETMPEFRRNAFIAMAQNPDTSRISAKFNQCLSAYYRTLITARETG